MKTKLLKSSEYNGLPFNLQDVILNQVRREELKWYPFENPPMPKDEFRVYLQEIGRKYLSRNKTMLLW
jgi:hypothetical protein